MIEHVRHFLQIQLHVSSLCLYLFLNFEEEHTTKLTLTFKGLKFTYMYLNYGPRCMDTYMSVKSFWKVMW